MEGLLVVLVIAAAVMSRPIEVRLWRAGKISDRALAIVVLARFPIVAIVFGLIVGAPIPLLILITALAIVPGLMFCRLCSTSSARPRSADSYPESWQAATDPGAWLQVTGEDLWSRCHWRTHCDASVG
jgi:hypothetical protein